MSLHTTKRKTATKYKLSQRKTPIKNWMNQGPFGDSDTPPSSHASGFSVNGGTRNIGYVGQTNLGKTSKSCCTNNSDDIKPSVLTTRGMLAKRYKWFDGSGNIVKPGGGTDQSQLIESQGASAISTVKLPRASFSADFRMQEIKKPLISQTGEQRNKYLNTGEYDTLCECIPNIKVVTSFSQDGDSNLLDTNNLHHHILFVPSGSGLDNPATIPGFGGGINPFGKPYSNGIVGFKSAAEPNPTDYYAAFTDTGDPCPSTLHITPDPSVVLQSNWSIQGRYLRSKNFKDMRLSPKPLYPGGDLQTTNVGHFVKSWEQLIDIKITWIAGNNTNGGDRPDLHAFNISSTNPVGDYRTPENLYVQFFDHNNQAMGQEIGLWKPKRDLTPAEAAAYAANPNINPWTPIPLNTYPLNVFTETTISSSDFNIDLSLANFFIIRQLRHTDKWDNYAVKHVEINFKC